MNCKQVQKLLPLSVGRDLDERREQMVEAHLQSCLECVDKAKEFRETREVLRDYESPAISQEVYADIRRRVIREIEAESTRPAPPQFVASLFRPRLTWALASGLIIVSMLAIFFTATRRNVEPIPGDKHRATVYPMVKHEPDQRSAGEKQTLLTTHEPHANDSRLIKVPRFQPRKSRDLITDRDTKVAGVSPQTNLAEPSIFPTRDSAASEKPVRLEIQTSDPNIRIIWFSQPNSKTDLPSLKGT